MTLVIAFIGKNGAVMAGDMREITFEGEKPDREKLEKELYSGSIVTDEEMQKKAEEFGVKITVADCKEKVSERNGVLVGEVSSVEGGVVKKRRLYASAGNFAIAELTNTEMTLTSQGKGSNFIAFGNEFTKQVANKCFKDNWTKKSNLQDAVKILILCMETVARKTASVSKQFMIVQTASNADVLKVVEKDRHC
ncbi:hypothetical protein DU57_12065 [Methanosarcina mazei]|uniref:Connectase MJ0548-like N-terminal domain-containing protein n=1 Tax=Methanosarcina mazei TaxID=2209 RepID=A0A0F8JA46_METMZ|nr:DUF2121 domain-containing protein [Methanosarcina mazei]KKG88023.1 hypothetical protein DU57_12065 [Methanosarcina mazei]KKG88534.1 hypothetical protein DU59_09745 [Methanosarcina mazei]KKH10024.1 hypothetical protein DU42_17020 [Methanosarcina mazei]MDO5840423.1 DUF2121 domain-containing protein [Methanosarcina mazei]